MATEVRLRRGTSAQHAAFVGAPGEATYNTETKTLHTHDGATPGGTPLAKLSDVAGGGVAGGAAPQGRLTLTADTPTPVADVASAATIYYVPAAGEIVTVYDGTKFLPHAIASLSLSLDATSGHAGYHASGSVFDVYAFMDGSTLRLGSGPAWGSTTSRGSGAAIDKVHGLLVNSSTMTLRFGSASGNTVTVPANRATFLGTFQATADGVATDTKRQRLLFNAYNQTLRQLQVFDPAANWTYSTGAWRQANGTTANQVEVLMGLVGSLVELALSALVNSSATGNIRNSIGIDSASPAADANVSFAYVDANFTQIFAHYSGCPGLGFHSLKWLEYGSGSGTQTWWGTNTDLYRNGLVGSVVI